MYTPRLYPRRFFGSHNVPATRAHNAEGQNGSPMAQLHDEIDRLFDGMFRGMMNPWRLDFMPRVPASDNGENAGVVVMPRLDVSSDEKAYTITAELPGVGPDDVKLEMRDNALILRGEKKDESKDEKKDYYVVERSYGSFERVLTLPDDAVADEIKATHKDGVLTISIPRREPEKPQSKTIEISKE